MPGKSYRPDNILGPVTHLDERAFYRSSHTVKQLKLETAAVDSELLANACACAMLRTLCDRRGGDGRFILKQICVRNSKFRSLSGFWRKTDKPIVLARLDFFEVSRRP